MKRRKGEGNSWSQEPGPHGSHPPVAAWSHMLKGSQSSIFHASTLKETSGLSVCEASPGYLWESPCPSQDLGPRITAVCAPGSPSSLSPYACSSLSLSLSKLEKRSLFLERSSAGQYANSDEEDGYASPEVKRRGTSVDDFLKGSELGKQVRVCTPVSALGWQGL